MAAACRNNRGMVSIQAEIPHNLQSWQSGRMHSWFHLDLGVNQISRWQRARNAGFQRSSRRKTDWASDKRTLVSRIVVGSRVHSSPFPPMIRRFAN